MLNRTMTSRERVWKALNFEEPDRVPIDIGSNFATGICIDAYVDLLKYLGYEKLLPPKAIEPFFMLAKLDDLILQRLHCDVVALDNPSMRWDIDNKDWKSWINQKGNTILVAGDFRTTEKDGCIYVLGKNDETLARMPKGGLYFDFVESLNMTADKIEKTDPEALKRSIPLYSQDHLRQLEEEAKRLFEETEYSICGGFCKGGMTMVPSIAGHSFADWLCILLTDQDYAYSIIQAIAEKAVENIKLYIEAVGKYIDTLFVSATDYGTQRKEMFQPEIFEKIYVPNYKIINDCVHKNCRAKTFFHCCGSIFNLFEHFINAGVDIINPVQISAENMDPVKIKQAFGDRIVLWGGGIDTQQTLQFGSVNDVKFEVKDIMKKLAPGGGFIFTQVHDIQFGVPPENILEMVDAAFEHGVYPTPCAINIL